MVAFLPLCPFSFQSQDTAQQLSSPFKLVTDLTPLTFISTPKNDVSSASQHLLEHEMEVSVGPLLENTTHCWTTPGEHYTQHYTLSGARLALPV